MTRITLLFADLRKLVHNIPTIFFCTQFNYVNNLITNIFANKTSFYYEMGFSTHIVYWNPFNVTEKCTAHIFTQFPFEPQKRCGKIAVLRVVNKIPGLQIHRKATGKFNFVIQMNTVSISTYLYTKTTGFLFLLTTSFCIC